MAKKYSINVENDEVVSVEVDGVRYDDPDQIPDPEDRARVMLLMSDVSDMDWTGPVGQATAMPRLILLIFLGVAILMLAIAVIAGVNTSLALSRETTTPGRVVDLVVRKDQDGQEFYYPVVEFYLPGEQRQTVQVSEGSWPPAYEKGQAVTVAYDPAQPHEARIKSFSSTLGMWILTIITGFLGLAFLAATLLARWLLKQ